MLRINRGPVAKPQKVVVYGPEGIGKTTFAAQFPDPLFVDTEDGTETYDVARTEAEQARVAAEALRVQAEAQRVSNYNAKMAEWELAVLGSPTASRSTRRASWALP